MMYRSVPYSLPVFALEHFKLVNLINNYVIYNIQCSLPVVAPLKEGVVVSQNDCKMRHALKKDI